MWHVVCFRCFFVLTCVLIDCFYLTESKQELCAEKQKPLKNNGYLGGGFKHALFSRLFGEDSYFDWYFSDGLKPPTRFCLRFLHGSLNYPFFGASIQCESMLLFCWVEKNELLLMEDIPNNHRLDVENLVLMIWDISYQPQRVVFFRRNFWSEPSTVVRLVVLPPGCWRPIPCQTSRLLRCGMRGFPNGPYEFLRKTNRDGLVTSFMGIPGLLWILSFVYSRIYIVLFTQ